MSQPGWYHDPQGSGRLRWWNGQHWTEHLDPQPPHPARRPPAREEPRRYRAVAAQERAEAVAPVHTPGQDAPQPSGPSIDATVRGAPLHADARVIAYRDTMLAWANVEWVAYWAASVPDAYGGPPGVQWIFQAGRHPFRGGPRVEVVLDDPVVTVHGRTPPGPPGGGEAEGVWTGLVELCRALAEPRLVAELAGRVRAGESIDVAQGLTVHPGGVRSDRVSLSRAAISGAAMEHGRVWIRQASGAEPVLYVPQQNPNAVLIPALMAALNAS